MIKLNSDSKWAGLTEEQRDTLEGWLFEEKITYQEALDRAQKEFGITASMSSIARFYNKMSDERLQQELAGYNDEISKKIAGAPDFNVEDLSHAATMLIANRLVQTTRHQPGNIKEIVTLAKALTDCQTVELKTRWYYLAHDRQMLQMKKEREAAASAGELSAMLDQFFKKKVGGNAPQA